MSVARRRAGGGGTAWLALAAVIAVALAVWWLSARRAEAPAPPATAPGARMLGAPPNSEEITAPEKQELQRILRERGATSPAAP